MPLYRKAKSPNWYYSLCVGKKRLRGSTHTADESDAKYFLAELQLKVRDEGVESVTKKSCTLRQLADKFSSWIDGTHSIEPATKRYYHHGVKLLLDSSLAEMKINAITNDVADMVTFPGANYTGNQALSTLKRMLHKAHEDWNLLAAMPKKKIEMRKVWGRSVIMTLANYNSLMSHMKGSDSKDVLAVLRGTGARPAEVYSMRWELMHLDEGYYQNPSGKTRTSKRRICLCHDSLAVLARRHLEQGSPKQGWVFASKTNRPSKSGHIVSIDTAFNRERRAAGLPASIVPYSARHAFATDVTNAGGSTQQVMLALGHSNPAAAMRYQHGTTDNLSAMLTEAKTTGRVQ